MPVKLAVYVRKSNAFDVKSRRGRAVPYPPHEAITSSGGLDGSLKRIHIIELVNSIVHFILLMLFYSDVMEKKV